jgi:hypothetical protein
MSDLAKLKEEVLNNPKLTNPEIGLVLDAFSKLEELEETLRSSNIETLASSEQFEILRQGINEAKEALEKAAFLSQELVIPELPEDTNND